MSTPPRRAGTDLDALGPALPLGPVAGVFLAALAGAAAAAWLLPAWAPALAGSLHGAQPKAAWYLARSSGLVAYLLVWLSMVLGLLLSTRLARTWPGAAAAFQVHQHASVLGLGFALFHGLVLLADRHLAPTLLQLALPFGVPGALRVPVGLGQTAFLLALPLTFSFWARGRLGAAAWRAIHLGAFAVFALALLHGAWAGSDAERGWAPALFLGSLGSVLFLALARGLGALWPARA